MSAEHESRKILGKSNNHKSGEQHVLPTKHVIARLRTALIVLLSFGGIGFGVYSTKKALEDAGVFVESKALSPVDVELNEMRLAKNHDEFIRLYRQKEYSRGKALGPAPKLRAKLADLAREAEDVDAAKLYIDEAMVGLQKPIARKADGTLVLLSNAEKAYVYTAHARILLAQNPPNKEAAAESFKQVVDLTPGGKPHILLLCAMHKAGIPLPEFTPEYVQSQEDFLGAEYERRRGKKASDPPSVERDTSLLYGKLDYEEKLRILQETRRRLEAESLGEEKKNLSHPK